MGGESMRLIPETGGEVLVLIILLILPHWFMSSLLSENSSPNLYAILLGYGVFISVYMVYAGVSMLSPKMSKVYVGVISVGAGLLIFGVTYLLYVAWPYKSQSISDMVGRQVEVLTFVALFLVAAVKHREKVMPDA